MSLNGIKYPSRRFAFDEAVYFEIKMGLFYDTFELDLTTVEFFDVQGLIVLRNMILDELENKRAVKVLFNPNIVNYLVKMRFPEAFLDKTNIYFEPELRDVKIHRNDTSSKLIEIKDFTVTNDDEEEQIINQIIEIIGKQLPDSFYNKLHADLAVLLGEVISNVYRHSETTRVTIAGQSYNTKLGNKFEISISDRGIGIPGKIRKLPGCHMLSPPELIKKALERNITTSACGGGMGLTELIQMMVDNRDTFCIRSDGGAYIYDKTETSIDCLPIKGTLVFLSFSDRSYKIDLTKPAQ